MVNKKSLSSAFLTAIIISGLILVSAPHFSTVQASTNISGLISSDTTWTLANSPIIVTGDIRVAEGVTLMIEPGVTVSFAGNYYLEIRGTLEASGTAYSFITFTSSSTSPQAGSWAGIRNWAYDAPSYPYVRSKGNITLNYCVIEYANIGIRGSLENDGNGNITNVIISNSKFVKNTLGIYLTCREYSTAYAHVVNNTLLFNNEGITIENRYNSPALTVEDNTIALNVGNGINIQGHPYPGDTIVRQNVITKNGGTGIYVSGAHTHAQSSIVITQNSVTLNEIGVYIFLEPLYLDTLAVASLNDNDFYSNRQYDLKVGTPSTYPLNLNATNNYWGTTNLTLIDQHIYDFYDNWDLIKVDYDPVLEIGLESRSQDFFEIHIRTLKVYTDGVLPSEPIFITKDGIDAGTVYDGSPLNVIVYRSLPSEIRCDDLRVWNSNENVRYRFVNWTGPAANDTNNAVTIALDFNNSNTIFYKTQYKTNFAFKDADGSSSLYTNPALIKIVDSSGNTMTTASYTGQWLDNVTWTLKQVLWQGNNVKPVIDPTYTPTAGGTWSIDCRIYPISLVNSFRDSSGILLYSLPSTVKLTFPNGTISISVNPNSTCQLQNGTITWVSVIWQGTEVTPEDGAFNAENGNPLVNCRVYSLTITPTFKSNNGSVLNLQPSSWTIRFPNSTTKTVSSSTTFPQVQTGIYSLTSMTWDGIEVFPIDAPNLTLTSSRAWLPNINCRLPTSLSLTISSGASYIGYKVTIGGKLSSVDGGISDSRILLEYSVTNGETWQLITSANTTTDGGFSAVWLPLATGDYIIRASWLGNSIYPRTNVIGHLAVTSLANQYVFSVSSNSTISELAFNSADRVLSFSASGPSSTNGYLEVTIAKALIANVTEVEAYLDGDPITFTLNENDDSWLLCFSYSHSSHGFAIHLGPSSVQPINTPDGTSDDSNNEAFVTSAIIIAVSSVIAFALIIFLFLQKKRMKKQI